MCARQKGTCKVHVYRNRREYSKDVPTERRNGCTKPGKYVHI